MLYLRGGALLVAVASVALAAAFWSHRNSGETGAPARIYRIGADQSPPFSRLRDGQLEGMNVDVLNEAARRAGIRLQWVPVEISADEALERKVVDLWPAGGSTPWRLQHLYLTDPWLHNNSLLISTAALPIRTIADIPPNRPVAYRQGGLMDLLAHQLLPGSVLQPHRLREEAIAAVCTGGAVAATMEARSMQVMLLHRPPACDGVGLHVSVLDSIPYQLSILARPEAAEAARILRGAIDGMLRDGDLLAIQEKWSPIASVADRQIFARLAADTNARWTLVVLAVVCGFAAILAGMLVLAHRARARARAAERESFEDQTRLRAVADNLPNGVVFQLMLDPDGEMRFLYLSSRIGELTGIPLVEALGDPQRLRRLILPEDWSALLDLRAASIRDLTVCDAEVRLRRPDGALRWIHLLAQPRPLPGDRTVWDGIMLDVTGRKAAEAALDEEAMRRRMLFEQSRDGIAVLDRDGNLLECNRAFAAMLGYTSEELRKMNVREWDAQWNSDQLGKKLTELTAAAATFETRHRRRDGSSYHVEISVTAATIGGVLSFYTLHRDITGRKAFEAELRTQRDRAEAGTRAKSAFLANMSHEIRTPMNGVIGMLQLLDETLADEEQRHYAAIAQASGRALLTLIDDILDLTRIEAHRVELEKFSFPLGDTVESIAQTIGIQAVAKGLSFRSSVSPGIPHLLLGDRYRLRQVLANLLGNAVKFTERGAVSLDVFMETRDGSNVTLRFTVADTGIGIGPDQLEGLFCPFAQADSSSTRKYGGTGLGLAIARRIIELMGGKLDVHSRPGEGSSFWFTARFEVAQQPPDEPAPAGNLNHRTLPARILVAEDDAINREVSVAQLRMLGHSAETVSNGAEAVAAVARERFDLVLMDCAMPVLDGFAATAMIRRSARAGIPIVALTAGAMSGDRTRCLAEGMNDYLAKPVELSALKTVLARWLPGATEIIPAKTFDPEAFLDRLMRDRELAADVLRHFLEDLPSQLQSLKAAFQGSDAVEVNMQAHRLKGAAGTVSALNLCALAARIESGGAAGDLEQCGALLARVADEAAAFRSAVECTGWLDQPNEENP